MVQVNKKQKVTKSYSRFEMFRRNLMEHISVCKEDALLRAVTISVLVLALVIPGMLIFSLILNVVNPVIWFYIICGLFVYGFFDGFIVGIIFDN